MPEQKLELTWIGRENRLRLEAADSVGSAAGSRDWNLLNMI